MSNLKAQDQRSLTDQLQEVWEFARKEKMYDAADFIVSKMKKFKTVVDGKEIRVLPIVSKGGGAVDKADVKNAEGLLPCAHCKSSDVELWPMEGYESPVCLTCGMTVCESILSGQDTAKQIEIWNTRGGVHF